MHVRVGGFTLVELLVVILILAILMAVAIPLYLRAVRDSERRTCRSNMQTIAHAEQAYRVRSAGHVYTENLDALVGMTEDLQGPPRCPSDRTPESPDYTVRIIGPDRITIFCDCDEAEIAQQHNRTAAEPDHGYTPGLDAE